MLTSRPTHVLFILFASSSRPLRALFASSLRPLRALFAPASCPHRALFVLPSRSLRALFVLSSHPLRALFDHRGRYLPPVWAAKKLYGWVCVPVAVAWPFAAPAYACQGQYARIEGTPAHAVRFGLGAAAPGSWFVFFNCHFGPLAAISAANPEHACSPPRCCRRYAALDIGGVGLREPVAGAKAILHVCESCCLAVPTEC